MRYDDLKRDGRPSIQIAERLSLRWAAVAALIVLAGNAAAQEPGLSSTGNSPSGNLIAHLPLDGSIVDILSGARPNVTVGTSVTDGRVGQAVHFDGTSYVQLPIDISPEAVPELTIAMWVRPDTLPGDPELRSAFYPNAYLISDGDGLLMINNQQKEIPYYEAYSTGTVIRNSAHPGMRGGWQLLAVTRRIEDRVTEDGELRPHSVLMLYSNGRVSEHAAPYRQQTILPYISLGALSKGRSDKFRGAIDDIRIYSRALSANEISKLARPESAQTGAASRATASTDPSGLQSDESITVHGGPLEIGINAESVAPAGGSRDEQAAANEAVPGTEGAAGREVPDRFGQPPSAADNIAGFEDDEARRVATEEAAIDNSPLSDGVATPAMDATAIDGGNDFSPPAIATDQRADAGPVAGTGSIGASDPGFTEPVFTADETGDLINSDEVQTMLQATDWRIEGMVPGSADKTELYPGDEVIVKIRVSKDDPANKIPSVRLVTNVGPGMPSPSYDLTINTAEGKPTDEREIPVTLPVPDNLAFADGAAQTVWRPKVWLNTQDGMPLRDAIRDNHSRQLALTVSNPFLATDCGDAVLRDGDYATSSNCLLNTFGKLEDQEPEEPHDVRFRVDLTNSVETAISGRYEESNTDVLIFEGRGSVLGFIKLGERGNRPCRLVIDDAWTNDVEPGQVIDKCAGSAGDYKEVRIPKDRTITAIAVCDSIYGNPRIKGVKIETRPILEDGSLGAEVRHQETAQQNCAAWKTMVRCPAGQVAGGIRASFFSGRAALATRESLSGVGLVCGPISVADGT